MKCSKCSHENSEGKKFCEACGEKLVAKCPACDAENPPGAKFCEKCGGPLKTQGSASPEAIAKSVVQPTSAQPQPPKPVEAPKIPDPPKVPEPPKVDVSKAPIPPQSPAKDLKPANSEPATPKQATPSTPSVPYATAPEKKGGLGIGAIIAGVLVLGAGAYFVMKPAAESTKPAESPPQKVSAATANPTPNTPAKAVVAPVANEPAAVPAQATTISLEASAKLAQPHLKAMLDGAKNNNEATIQSAVDAIKQLSLPPKGNRKASRAANDEGLAALKANALDDAIAKFKEGVAADSSDQEIINNLGHTYILQGKIAEAAEAIQQALTLAPNRSSAWVNLAFTYAKSGKNEEAVAAYLLAYKFSPNQQKTRAFIAKQSQEDPDQKVRDAATSVLGMISSQ